MKMVIKSR